MLLPQLPFRAQQDPKQGPLPREVHGDDSQESSRARRLHQGLGGGPEDGQTSRPQGSNNILRLVPDGRSACSSSSGCLFYTSVGCLPVLRLHVFDMLCPLGVCVVPLSDASLSLGCIPCSLGLCLGLVLCYLGSFRSFFQPLLFILGQSLPTLYFDAVGLGPLSGRLRTYM